MLLDDVAAEDEAEAVLAAYGQGAVGAEEALHLRGVHAAAGVADGYLHHVACRSGIYHHPTLLGVLQRVVDDVTQHDDHQQAVGIELQRGGLEEQLDVGMGACHLCAHLFEGFLQGE